MFNYIVIIISLTCFLIFRELKQAMEQKRCVAMSFLPNKSAPNLHNNNHNNTEDTENLPLEAQQQTNIYHYIKNSKQNFSPQLHPKFLQQQQKMLQQQMYSPGIYASAQTINEDNPMCMRNAFVNYKAMSSAPMSPTQTICQLNPSHMHSSQAFDSVVGRRPPPSWQQQHNQMSSQQPPAVPMHRKASTNNPNLTTTLTTNLDDSAEQQVLIEARNLRLHQQRLEQRSRVLEEQNRQLQMQLERLNRLVDKVKYFFFFNFIEFDKKI